MPLTDHGRPLWWTWIQEVEGGFTDHPDDPGGPTKMGVTQEDFNRYLEGQGDLSRPVRDATAGEIEAILTSFYWHPCHCGEMPYPLNLVLFDTALLHGVDQASRFLQRLLPTVLVDGIIGPKTMKGLRDLTQEGKGPGVLATLCITLGIIAQRHLLIQVLEAKGGHEAFIQGWKNRLEKLVHLKSWGG